MEEYNFVHSNCTVSSFGAPVEISLTEDSYPCYTLKFPLISFSESQEAELKTAPSTAILAAIRVAKILL
jgi:hypothetical protein